LPLALRVLVERDVIAESNLFKVVEQQSLYKSNFKYGSKIKDINKLNIGDYVVHSIHGIGIYGGIEALNKNGLIKDYLVVNYRGNDKLYIPVEKIELLQKYSSGEGSLPKVNKLGGTEWQKIKLRIKNRLRDIADKLLKVAAEREIQKGFAFGDDTEEQVLFENDFIYDETKDQLLVSKQIKDDMEKDVPMDRLLCGDVGYGKTEVAFRAMFKAVSNSKQVAYLCPTTILSNQHYENAIERFSKFPVRIALLNRFTSPKRTKEILTGLQDGSLDVIIGTHRLLSKDIKFKDLGLLIVDEEQRFGVSHKEKIKEYRANIDVLTLSATPIPRTLQSTMLGLRNLSLIETPPMNRYPVQTYVLEQSDYIIRDAIYKELSRNGQVFLLYNKVDSIITKVTEIKRLVPEAKITYAHGQMSKKEIEDTMLRFVNHEFDVLICTTIIETGIDIANVNTLIIIDADKFGLSQLYQIRGRVGRSDRIAYAYLMYDKKKVLNETAVKRLNAIKEFTELGSGFAIALRDLSIRGAGDILGKEQAGFIDSVGIELYLKMLNDEVQKLKGIPIEEEQESEEKPLLDVTTHIDDKYVENEDLKIEIHRKINEIDSYQKLVEIKSELEDRFGPVDEKLLIYMYEEWFERIAKIVGIENVAVIRNSVELTFNREASSKIEVNNLFMKASEITRMFRFSYNHQKLKIILDTIKLEKHWLFYITKLLQDMLKSN
jgi:transcription-repair coupling factor (superfamily II helicase)